MKTFRNNKGLSLVELIVTMAITGIVVATAMMILVSSLKFFRNGMEEVNLQNEVQRTLNLVQTHVMSADTVEFNDKTLKLTCQSPLDKRNTDTKIIRWDDTAHKLYYKENSGAETLMADFVTGFSFDVAEAGNGQVILSIEMKNGKKHFEKDTSIYLRNAAIDSSLGTPGASTGTPSTGTPGAGTPGTGGGTTPSATAKASSLTVSISGTHYVGDTLSDSDFDVTVTYDDGTKQEHVSIGWNVNSYDVNAGSNTYTVKFTDPTGKSVTGTCTYTGVQRPTVTDISATVKSGTYYIGDDFSSSNITVVATYSDGSTSVVTGFTTNPSPITLTSASTTVTVMFEGKVKDISIPAEAKPVRTGITATCLASGCIVGQTLSKSDIKVESVYDKGPKGAVANADWSADNLVLSSTSNTITISAFGFSCTVNVSATEPAASSGPTNIASGITGSFSDSGGYGDVAQYSFSVSQNTGIGGKYFVVELDQDISMINMWGGNGVSAGKSGNFVWFNLSEWCNTGYGGQMQGVSSRPTVINCYITDSVPVF